MKQKTLLDWYKDKLTKEGNNVSNFTDQQLTYKLGKSMEGEYGPQKIKEYPEFNKQYTSVVNAYKAEDLGRDGFFGGVKEIGAGIGQGIDETQGMLYGGAGFLAKKVGLDGASDYLMGKSMENMEESQVDAPTIQSYSEVNSFGEGLRYLSGGIGRVIPSGATMVGTGGIGGLIGKQVLKKAVVGPALKKYAKRLTKKGIDADDYTKSIGKRYAELAPEMQDIAKGYAAGLSMVGTTTAASGTMGIGEVYSSLYPYTQLDKQDSDYVTPESAEALSWKFGLAIGALDTILPSMVGPKLLKKFFPGKNPTASDIKLADDFVKRTLLKQTAKGMALEGGTEATQEYLNVVAEKFAHNEESPFDLTEFSDQEIDTLIDGGILGMIGGATFSGATELAAGAKSQLADRKAEKEKKEELQNNLDEIIKVEAEKAEATEEAVSQIAPTKAFDIGQKVITKEGDVVEFKGLSGEDAVIAVKPNPDLDRLVEKRVPLKSLSKYEEVESSQEEEVQSPESTEIRDLIIERDYLKEELKAGASPEATMRIAEINKKLDDYSASEKTSVDNFREEKIAEQEGTKEGRRRKKKSEYQEEQDAKDTLREREVNGIPLPEAQAYLMLNELLADETITSDDLTKGKLKDKEGFTEAFKKWSVMFYGSRNPGYKEFITAFKNGTEKFHGSEFKTAGDLAADQKKAEDIEKTEQAENLKDTARKAKEKFAQRKEEVQVADRIRKIQGGKSEIFKVRASDANYSETYPKLELAYATSKNIGKPLDIEPISKKDWEKEFSAKNLSDKNKNPGTGKIAGQNSYDDYVKDFGILKSTLEANTSDKAKVDEILNRQVPSSSKSSSSKKPNSPTPPTPVVEEIDGSTLDAIPTIENGKYVFIVGASKSILNVNPDVVSRGGKFKKERSDYNQLSDLVLSLEKPFDVSEVITPSNQKIKISFDGASVNYTINSEDNYQVVASKSKDEAKYIYGKEDGEFDSLEDPSTQTHVRVKDSQNFEGRTVNPEEIILGTDTTKKYQLRNDLPNGTDTGSVHLVAIKHEKSGSIFVRSVKREKTEIKIAHLKRKTRQSTVQVNLGEEASSMSVSELPEGFSVYGSVWLSATKGSLRQDFTSSNEYETWVSAFKVLPMRETGQTAKKKISDIENKANSEEYQNEVIQAYKDEKWDVVEEAEAYFTYKIIKEEAPNEAQRVQELMSIRAGLEQASKELQAAQNKLVEPYELTGTTALSADYKEYEGQVEEFIKQIDEGILSEEGDIWSKIEDAEETIDSQIKEANKAYEDAKVEYSEFISMPRKDENGNEIDGIILDDWINDENTKDADFPFSIELSMSLFGYPTADPASEIKIEDAVRKLPMEDRKSIADAVGRDAKIQDRDKKAYIPRPTKNAKLALKNNYKHITDENVNKFAKLLYKAIFDRYQINNDTERQVDGAREVKGKDGEMQSVYLMLGIEASTSPERFSDQVWNEEVFKDRAVVDIKQFGRDDTALSWITAEQINILVEYSKNNLQGFSEIQDITDTLNLTAHKDSESAKPGELKKPEAIVYNLLFSENGGRYSWGAVEEPGVVYQFLQWMGDQNPLSDAEKASEAAFTKASDSQAWIALAERFSEEGVKGGIKENSINILQQVYKESDSSRYPSAAEATLHSFNLARTQDPDKAFNYLSDFTNAISKIAIGNDGLGSQILNAIGESKKVSDIANAIDAINDKDLFDTTRRSMTAQLEDVKSLIEGFAKDAIKQLGERYKPYALFNRVISAKKLKPSIYGIPQTKVEKDAVNAEEPTNGISATGMPVIQNMSDLYLGDSTSYSIADNADNHNVTQSLKRRTNFEQNVILSEDQQARNKRAIENIIGDNIFAPVVLEKMKRYVENYGISEKSNEFLYKYLEVVEKALAGRDAPLSVIPVDNILSTPNSITRGNRVDDSVFINRKFHAGKNDFIAEELPFNFVEDKTTNVLMSVLMHEVWHGTMETQLRAHEDKARVGQRSEVQETYDLIKDVISEIKKTKGANKFTFLFSNDQVAVSETLNYAWTRKDFAKFLSETKITNEGIKTRIDKNGKNLISTLMDALYAAYVKLLNTFGINTEGSALGSILELSRQLEAQNQALLPGVSIPSNIADRKTYDFLMNDSLDNSRISVEVLQNYKKDVAEEYLKAFEHTDDASYVTAVITGDFDGLTPDELGYVKDSLKKLNPRMRNLLRALQRDDYLGFDTPFEAIDAILTEDTESLFSNFDMSPSLKSGITKYMDSLLGTKTKPNKSLSFPIGQDLQMAGRSDQAEGKSDFVPLIVSDFILDDKSFLDVSTIDESLLKKLREEFILTSANTNPSPSIYLGDVTRPINAFHDKITGVLKNDLDFYNQFKSRGTEDGDIKAKKMLNAIIERIGDIEIGKAMGARRDGTIHPAQEALNSLNPQGVIDGIVDQLQKIKEGSTTDLQMTEMEYIQETEKIQEKMYARKSELEEQEKGSWKNDKVLKELKREEAQILKIYMDGVNGTWDENNSKTFLLTDNNYDAVAQEVRMFKNKLHKRKLAKQVDIDRLYKIQGDDDLYIFEGVGPETGVLYKRDDYTPDVSRKEAMGVIMDNLSRSKDKVDAKIASLFKDSIIKFGTTIKWDAKTDWAAYNRAGNVIKLNPDAFLKEGGINNRRSQRGFLHEVGHALTLGGLDLSSYQEGSASGVNAEKLEDAYRHVMQHAKRYLPNKFKVYEFNTESIYSERSFTEETTKDVLELSEGSFSKLYTLFSTTKSKKLAIVNLRNSTRFVFAPKAKRFSKGSSKGSVDIRHRKDGSFILEGGLPDLNAFQDILTENNISYLEGKKTKTRNGVTSDYKGDKVSWREIDAILELDSSNQSSFKNRQNIATFLHYGLVSYEEFLTEAMSNREFQEYLATIPASNPSKFANAWKELINLIGRVLGIDIEGTMLEQVLNDIGDSFRYTTLRGGGGRQNALEAFDLNSPGQWEESSMEELRKAFGLEIDAQYMMKRTGLSFEDLKIAMELEDVSFNGDGEIVGKDAKKILASLGLSEDLNMADRQLDLFEKPEIVTKLPLRDLTRLAARDINWGGNDRQMDRQLANLISENTSVSYMDALNEIDSLHAIFDATPNKQRERFKQEARDKGIKNYYGRGQAMEDSLDGGDRNPNENQTLDRDANEIAGAKMQAAATNELLASISESMEDIRRIFNEPTLSVEDVIKKFFKGSRSPIKQVKQLVKNYDEAMADMTIESIKPNEGMAQHSRTIALRKIEFFLKQSREALSTNLDQLDPKQDKSLVSEITNLEKGLIVDPSVIFDRSNHGDNLSKQIKHEVQTARQETADTVIDDIDTGNSSLIQAFAEIRESKTLSEDFINTLKKRKGSYSSQYLSDLIFKVSKVDDIQALTPKDIYNIIKVDGKLSDNEYIIISSAINRNKDSVHQARLSSSDNYQGKRTTLKKLEDLSKSTVDQLKVIKGKNPEKSLLTGTKQERQILESFINKRISYLEKLELVKDIEKSNQVYRSINKHLKVNSSRLQTYLHHSPVTNIVDGMTFPVMKKVEGDYQLSSIKVRLSNKMLPEDIKEFVEARQNNRDYLADPINEKIQATSDFEYIRNATIAADALTLQPQHREAQGKLNGWWLKSAQEMFGETGRIGKEIQQMELKFDIAYRTYISQAKAHGRRWNRKLLNASEAWGYKNERLFLDQIYDKVLKWNEDQPQLNDKASFDSGTYEKALSLVPDKEAMTDNARQALRELLEQSRVVSSFMMGVSKILGNKVTEEGVKVSSKFSTDEDYEMQDLERDPIRRGYQTSGRKIRSEYVLGIVNELSGKGWADEESWSDVVEAVKDKNVTEEAKVRAMDAYLEIGVDEYVLDKFIRPYLLDTSVRGLLTLPDGGKIPRNYLVSAWENSEGQGHKRFLSFIDTLYESVPHKTDGGDYIGFKYGVIKAFNKRYQRLFEMVSDVGGANDNKAYALAHRLMDSRSMETIIPVEFLQYETYTEVDTQIHIAQIIGNSVYGRGAERLTSLRNQLEGELKDKRARLTNIADMLGMTPPNSAPFKIKRGLRQRAAQLVEGMQDIPGETGNEKLKNLEAATRQLANFHKANKHLQAHLEGDVGPFKDHKLLLELLGTNAFLILNQPKSGLTNLLSLADQPLVYKGFNKFSRKALSSSLANVFGNIFGPMIEKTGLQLQVTSDYAQWLNDVYFKSSEHEVGFSDYKLNLGGEASKKASKLEIFKLDGLRQLKDSLQYTPVKKDQKYAPFALRTMFLNPFTYLGNLANHSLGVGAVNAVDMLVKQAADFIEQTGQRTGQPLPQTFQVTAENLGLEKKSFTGEAILGSESMFNYVNNAIEQRGLGTISDLAHQYIERKAKGKTLALTKDQAIAISTIALHDVAMEGGFTSRSAFWYTNEWAKYAAPLLSWSFSKVNQVNKSFRNEQTSEIELQASIRALSVMALWLAPVGMAFTFGMDEYDEEILGKASSLRPISKASMIPIFGPFMAEGDAKSNALAMTERLARAGNIGGIAGDFFASIVSNVDPYTTQRGFSLDTRILGMATILNIRDALTNAHHSRSFDYNLVVRPLLYSMGGNSFMQTTQAASNLLGFDVIERRVSDMIGNRNKVRAALSTLDIERKPVGPGGFKATPFSIHIRKMEQAAYSDDNKLFEDAYSRAIEASIERGDEGPEAKVLQSYKRRTLRSGISRYTLDDNEWGKILDVFTPEHSRSLERAQMMHEKYEDILKEMDDLNLGIPIQSFAPIDYEQLIKQSLSF